MALKSQVRSTFKETQSIEPFYTGGAIVANDSGTFLVSTIDDEDCLIVDATSAKPLHRIEGDGEAITSIAITPDADFVILCSRSMSMRIFRLSHIDGSITAELTRSLKPHATPVVASSIDQSGALLATGGADGIVKVWDIRAGYCSHTFHCHGGVVTALTIFEAQSAGKSTKKRSSASTSRNGEMYSNSLFLASSAEDGRIKVHDLNTRQQVAALDSHVSVVRTLRYSPDQELLLSASRDRTLVLWNVRSWTIERIITAGEEIETAGFIPGGQYLYAGGEGGRLRTWSTADGRELQMPAGRGLETDGISTTLLMPGQYSLLTVRSNQVLEQWSYQSLEQRLRNNEDALVFVRAFFGNLDEVIDMVCLGPDLLAVADNSESVKVLCTATESGSQQSIGFGSSVTSLQGHQDVIICMSADEGGNWLATGSKDNTARLWKLEDGMFSSFAIFSGHTASIGAISLPKGLSKATSPSYIITGSEDKTIKKWDTSKLSRDVSIEPHAVAKAAFTRVAHDKDINAIALSPLAPLLASASQDKTIKIWSIEDGSTTAVLKGHKRGVWSIQFSPVGTPALQLHEGGSSGNRGLLVSGSGDNTVKVWSLNTYTCLLTLEGHQNSVLKVIWLPAPVSEDGAHAAQQQHTKPMIASASSDTLVKLWSPFAPADSDHLLVTLDGHTDRVWSLTSPAQQSSVDRQKLSYSFISGAADAKIAFWTNTTAATATEASKVMTERVEQDQMLQNHIRARNYKEVITLSLALNHPGRLLKVFEDVVSLPEAERDSNSYMGLEVVDNVLANLSQEQVYKLLERVRDWNTNARTAIVAQKVLNCLLRKYPQRSWTEMARDKNILRLARSSSRAGASAGGNAVKDLFRALQAYTERHYKRIEDLTDETYLLEYTLREMDEISDTMALSNGTVHASEDMIMVQ